MTRRAQETSVIAARARRESRIEDWDFMARNGATFNECARRLGLTPAALESTIQRAREAGDPRALTFTGRDREVSA